MDHYNQQLIAVHNTFETSNRAPLIDHMARKHKVMQWLPVFSSFQTTTRLLFLSLIQVCAYRPSPERVGLKATGNEWPEQYMNGAGQLGNRLRFNVDRNYQNGRQKSYNRIYQVTLLSPLHMKQTYSPNSAESFLRS